MQTVLFHSTIFGPIHSRRLGVSLGVNLSPTDGKTCTFDCLYCEAGFNAQGAGTSGLPSREQVASQLEQKLQQMSRDGEPLDVITFSGNGEPTLHPQFPGIIDDTIALRNRYYPQAKVSVLSNATLLYKQPVKDALMKVDNNIQKLDSAVEATVQLIDRPVQPFYAVRNVVERLREFHGHVIVQTMMLRGEYEGRPIDNTTPEEVAALIQAYQAIGPQEVMLYSIDRRTPAEQLVKVPAAELEAVAEQIRMAGIPVQVSC